MYSWNVKAVVTAGIFIALIVLFTYVFSIQTPFVRLSFGFLPLSIYAAISGAWRGALVGALADLLGSSLFFPGSFFPGFTLSSSLSGMIYGYFLHQRPLSWTRTILPFLLIFLLIDLGLNTLWLVMLYHQAASVFFASRVIKGLVCLPINLLLFHFTYRPLAVLEPKIH